MDPVGDEHSICQPAANALTQLIQTREVTPPPFADNHDDRTGRISLVMRHLDTRQNTSASSERWHVNFFKDDC